MLFVLRSMSFLRLDFVQASCYAHARWQFFLFRFDLQTENEARQVRNFVLVASCTPPINTKGSPTIPLLFPHYTFLCFCVNLFSSSLLERTATLVYFFTLKKWALETVSPRSLFVPPIAPYKLGLLPHCPSMSYMLLTSYSAFPHSDLHTCGGNWKRFLLCDRSSQPSCFVVFQCV